MDSDFCSSQTNVPQPADLRGCFLLSHDTPTSKVDDYNTTDDILDFISDEKYAHFFKSDRKNGIALCFKTNGFSPCDNSTDAQNWFGLVDDFFDKANQIIRDNNLNVEFIMDGVGTPGAGRTCLNQKYRPWVSTYIYPNDPSDAITSNNPLKGYDRFQVLNEPEQSMSDPEGWIDYFASIDYGKFSNGSYPYQFWEPSDQDTILEVCDAYLAYPDEMHEEGFKFAINIDPVIFQIYTASRSGTAYNIHLIPKAENPLILTFLNPLSSHPSPFTLLVVYSLDDANYYQFYGAPKLFDQIEQKSPPRSLPSSFPVTSLSSPSKKENFLSFIEVMIGYNMGANNGTYYEYYALNWVDYKLEKEGEEKGVGGGEASSGSIASCFWGEAEPFLIEASVYDLTASSSCALNWSISNVLSPSSLVDSFCLDTDFNLTNPFVSVASTTLNSENGGCEVYSVVRVGVKKEKIYEAVIQATLTPSSSSPSVSLNQMSKLKEVDVGGQPRIAMTTTTVNGNEHVVCGTVHAEGFCWNNHHANTRNNPRLCDQTPSSDAHSLSYSFAPFSSHSSFFEKNENYFSVCDDDKLVGTYDQGSSPSVAFWESAGEVAMVMAHEGSVDPLDAFCASTALPFNGIVLDAWKVPYLPLGDQFGGQ
uniref:Uncharacterized protein n=1 Tax=Paramoeba aestuarina TaxID=180227 RepID=A0A7S4PIC6_9EUKA